MKKGIIFDVDGTIWDSRAVAAKAWNKAIKEHSSVDIHVTAEQLGSLFGKPMFEISNILFPALTEEKRNELSVYCYEYENELLKTEPGTLYPQVKETLEALSHKYPLYIVSNCQCGYIEICMKGTGIEKYITDYISYGDTELPKGENIKFLMERNHLTEAIYVGDTQGDADACAVANVKIVYAAYGFGRILNAYAQINEFADLKDLFL